MGGYVGSKGAPDVWYKRPLTLPVPIYPIFTVMTELPMLPLFLRKGGTSLKRYTI